MKIQQKDGAIQYMEGGRQLMESREPAILESWDGEEGHPSVTVRCSYSRIDRKQGCLVAEADISTGKGEYHLEDTYCEDGGEIVLSRELSKVSGDKEEGVRLWYDGLLFPAEKASFSQLKFFAPPELFDKNDLDDDGLEDYFRTQNLVYRDDRFNYPMILAYSERTHEAMRMEREDLPKYDSIPDRGINQAGEKVSVFLQKTDIGSLGVSGTADGTYFRTCYPFYEGDATIGLYIIKTVPFGAFWPLDKGESIRVSYRFSSDTAENFHEAAWGNVKRVIHRTNPQADPLPASAEDLVSLRLKALNEYYVEAGAEEDPNEPAGFVMNCHPQDGIQLENIIQYGFTGQNILNAWNMLRHGYKTDNKEYVRRALKISDFFADKMQMKDTGMFYNLYNVDMKKMNFWWTGLLLPLAYAEDDELEGLMGPLYEYRKEVIDTLAHMKGAYLRCMNEDVTALLRIYREEKKHGKEHSNWIEAVLKYGEFLLRVQEEDGGWRRAYSVSGEPIVEPVFWFGGTVYEQKSSTGTSIPLLVELYDYTGDERFLQSAKRAGDFVKEYIIDRVKFNGGVHDSIYSKGQLIDNESILYPMFGMLALYEATKEEKYLEGAHRAARYCASWVCLWKVPLPEGSTLVKYGYNSIGMGACDTCGSGYQHPFQLMCVAEIAQIAIYTGDAELLKTAELYWKGCNQTVALPEKDWGYASYGLQEEGYLASWWAVDDPMFSADTGFGYRLKGEGNKTCFSWIPAVAVKGYWSLLDRFGTCDFDEIKDRLSR